MWSVELLLSDRPSKRRLVFICHSEEIFEKILSLNFIWDHHHNDKFPAKDKFYLAIN
jgi:hypothetical protein